jgi:hypothetical protein
MPPDDRMLLGLAVEDAAGAHLGHVRFAGGGSLVIDLSAEARAGAGVPAQGLGVPAGLVEGVGPDSVRLALTLAAIRAERIGCWLVAPIGG